MASVTQRIREVKQPYGGYLPRKSFKTTATPEIAPLHPQENVHPGLVGTAVDYLSRWQTTGDARAAFGIPLLGASLHSPEERVKADALVGSLKQLDEEAAVAALKLAGYDVVVRFGVERFVSPQLLEPDAATVENVLTMVRRTMAFLEAYGPVTKEMFTFSGAYTEWVDSGDGDFLTADTLWEMKVLKKHVSSSHTLQVLMYYLMGKRSGQEEFQSLEHLGIFNPRQCLV